MRNLIWQYHIDTNRSYDGPHRKMMAMASSALVSFYAMKCAVEYHMACHSKWYSNGYHGGPAMERFQLLEERYDVYDYILYLDTDILISKNSPNIFTEYPTVDIAGINMPHTRDNLLLENGWLANEFPNKDRYTNNYVNGAILLLSRNFRQYLRKHLNVDDIQVDKGTYWDRDGIKIKWPVYDQSMLSYYLSKSNFNLTKLDAAWHRGPHYFNFGGAKNENNIKRFFADYKKLHEEWISEEDLPK